MSKVFTICPGLENMGAIKSGGQGSVYKGRRSGEMLTAIKILPTPIHFEDESDRNFRDFQNEVEKLKKVNSRVSPHVVKILSSGITESGSFPFIEMEFVEGPGLEDMLQHPSPAVFTIAETIKVAEQLAAAIAHCHRVNVKHGDIKSNNVKLNESSGNYVLLDFGMAIMSDEQRRTSIRYAGAIEFMAPEQNEGLMFYETDIYSYGIVIYELLAGNVPFILKDKSETSRNKVMLSHIEMPVPHLFPVRQKNLPQEWNESKKESEMQIPVWLIQLINKCLEKKPENRFKDGIELHEFILNKKVEATEINSKALARLSILKNENERLRSLVNEYQEKLRQKENEVQTNNTTWENKAVSEYDPSIYFPVQKRSSIRKLSLPFTVCAIIFVVLFLLFKNPFVKSQEKRESRIADSQENANDYSKQLQYKVKASRAYFHTYADPGSKRNAYLLASNQLLTAIKDSNNFIYIEFVNAYNKRSIGWLRKQDLQEIKTTGRNINLGDLSSNQ